MCTSFLLIWFSIRWEADFSWYESASDHHHHNQIFDLRAGAGASSTSVGPFPGNWLAARIADLTPDLQVLLQGSKILLVRSYLRLPQAAGQVKILIFLVKIEFFPIYANIFCDARQVPIFRNFEACPFLRVNCGELPLTAVFLCQFLPCLLGPPCPPLAVNLHIICCSDHQMRSWFLLICCSFRWDAAFPWYDSASDIKLISLHMFQHQIGSRFPLICFSIRWEAHFHLYNSTWVEHLISLDMVEHKMGSWFPLDIVQYQIRSWFLLIWFSIWREADFSWYGLVSPMDRACFCHITLGSHHLLFINIHFGMNLKLYNKTDRNTI